MTDLANERILQGYKPWYTIGSVQKDEATLAIALYPSNRVFPLPALNSSARGEHHKPGPDARGLQPFRHVVVDVPRRRA